MLHTIFIYLFKRNLNSIDFISISVAFCVFNGGSHCCWLLVCGFCTLTVKFIECGVQVHSQLSRFSVLTNICQLCNQIAG